MLDSIFQQDYPNIQLIVSDDGSPDFNVETVKQYIEENKGENIRDVIVRKNPQNMGTVKHVHSVLQLVEDEYFALSAADDRFFGKSAIRAYVQAFAENPDKAWVVAQACVTSADYKRTIYTTPTAKDIPYFKQQDPIHLYSRWSRRSMAIPCSMAFKKSAVDAVGGIDLAYQYIEDWPLELKLLRNGYMPIFVEKTTAIHSAGGITNTNVYGTVVRKAFFEDKKRIFRTEAEAHMELLTPEDQKAYRQYRREILDRQYFFAIELPEHPGMLQKILFLLKKPIRILWYMEEIFKKRKSGISTKKMLFAAQVLLLFSLLFETNCEASAWGTLFRIISIVDGFLGVLLIPLAVFWACLSRYCNRKDRIRKELVN